MRWPLADEAGAALFAASEVVGPEPGSGRLSGLEFLPVTARTILNPVPGGRMPFKWTINVYRGCSHACTYCFARPTHEYLGLNVGDDFDRRIVVKINAVERAKLELNSPGWTHETVALGSNTDPYQRAEGKFRLTRGVVEALGESRTPFSILTKSPLVLRDLDLLKWAAARTSVRVMFSVGTLDPAVWRVTEPGAPDPRRRLDAMRAVAAAGIETGGLIGPVLPGLGDGRAALTETVTAILDAGGSVVGATPLHLRGKTKGHYLEWLSAYDPHLHARYLQAYGKGAHVSAAYSDWVDDAVEQAKAAHARRGGAAARSLTWEQWYAA